MAMAEPPLPPSPAPAPMSAASSARPILLMVGSVLAFAIMDALVKDLGTRYPTMQVMFFRSIFAFVPILLVVLRSEEHTSELQSLMRISYAVFCLKKNRH